MVDQSHIQPLRGNWVTEQYRFGANNEVGQGVKDDVDDEEDHEDLDGSKLIDARHQTQDEKDDSISRTLNESSKSNDCIRK